MHDNMTSAVAISQLLAVCL